MTKKKTSFGFKKVSPEEKTHLVQDVFDRVAGKYDLMNDVLSLGIHRLWKAELIKMLRPRPHIHLLDVAGGTGDIALKFLKSCAYSSNVTVYDANQSMLKAGFNRAIDQGILKGLSWICGDAAVLPFQNNFYDAYSIAFGLRNVTDIEGALKEAYRVLKPGGMFFCLEFSKITLPSLAKLYKFYSFNIIPTLGSLIAKDKDAYQYLVESIEEFYSQEALATLLQKAGFSQVSYQNLSSGIVAIHSGIKV